MSETLIGLLHPGEMGAAVAGCLTGRGYRVLWVPAGRGPATQARAAAAGLTAAAGPDAAGQAADLARRADIILSICPPHAALPVAREVDAAAFTGVFVDANAISPSTRPPGGGGHRGSRGQCVRYLLCGLFPAAQGRPPLSCGGP
jgi:3-hydroxyisobutyrate dehydrogenase-like beta-hydroxyacid dehydrogenase